MPETSGLKELQDLVRDLGKMPKDLSKEMRPKLKRIGDDALREAKANASFSSRIPGATRLKIGFTKRFTGLALSTSRTRAPHARAHENGGKPGTFRHPLFGNYDVWVSQRARPYMAPAAKKWQASIDEEIGEVVDGVIRPYGFR